MRQPDHGNRVVECKLLTIMLPLFGLSTLMVANRKSLVSTEHVLQSRGQKHTLETQRS